MSQHPHRNVTSTYNWIVQAFFFHFHRLPRLPAYLSNTIFCAMSTVVEWRNTNLMIDWWLKIHVYDITIRLSSMMLNKGTLCSKVWRCLHFRCCAVLANNAVYVYHPYFWPHKRITEHTWRFFCWFWYRQHPYLRNCISGPAFEMGGTGGGGMEAVYVSL